MKAAIQNATHWNSRAASCTELAFAFARIDAHDVSRKWWRQAVLSARYARRLVEGNEAPEIAAAMACEDKRDYRRAADLYRRAAAITQSKSARKTWLENAVDCERLALESKS